MTDDETSDQSAAVAVSLDGHAFRFNDGGHSPFVAGSFVALTEPGGRFQVGQIDELTFGRGGSATGSGKILGIIDPQN